MHFAIKCSSSDPHSLHICSDRFPPPLHGNGHCQQEAQTSHMLLSQLSRNLTNFMCTDMKDFFFKVAYIPEACQKCSHKEAI